MEVQHQKRFWRKWWYSAWKRRI